MAGKNHIVLSTENREHIHFASDLLSHNLRPLVLPYNERCSSGLIFRIRFGKTVATGNEAYVRRILGVVHTLEHAASPEAYLCDTLSILQYGFSDNEGAYAIRTMFRADSETTTSAMMSLLQCIVQYPEWQKRGQEDVDTVCGDHLSQFDDIPSVLGYHPITASVVPHILIKDDTYVGYFFAGTIVHANQWAIQNYPAFGFGRRICPGLNIAERSLYILTARRNFEAPEYEYTEGFNVKPLSFYFGLVERNRRKVCEDVWEKAKEEWRRVG
ncbi:cytochrome P450 [Trichophaea hybrida]|nr:cytochrome P450 [Trichophaea hybrida]